MKLYPLVRAFRGRPGVEHLVLHTGQHYDPLLSERFFQDLRLPPPAHHLGIGSGTQAVQTAAIMTALEPLFLSHAPDLVLVYGDVNSTLAAALVTAKLGIPLGHVEAGLRSGDRTMPEEINRLVTDRIADLHFTPSPDATAHLRAEGAAPAGIHEVGNVMIDTLVTLLPRAEALRMAARLGVEGRPYLVATLHRPVNVDHPAVLAELLGTLQRLAADVPVIFPVHPRTRQRIDALGWRSSEVRLVPPVGYLEMLGLVATSAAVITDSGGLQEETSFMGVPCVTVRETTERPITCTLGTNRLVAAREGEILEAVRRAALERPRVPPTIPLWDGRAGERIAEIIVPSSPASGARASTSTEEPSLSCALDI